MGVYPNLPNLLSLVMSILLYSSGDVIIRLFSHCLMDNDFRILCTELTTRNEKTEEASPDPKENSKIREPERESPTSDISAANVKYSDAVYALPISFPSQAAGAHFFSYESFEKSRKACVASRSR